MKKCSTCKIEKELIEFNKNKNLLDGLRNQCKSCDKLYRIKNAEKLSQYGKQYRKDNDERLKQYYLINATKIKERVKKYSQLNLPKRSEYNRKYIKTKHGKLAHKALTHKRRALIKANTIGKHWTPQDITLKLKLQHSMCVYCETSINEYYEIDHIIPASKGGGNEAWNIQLLCKQCNGNGGKGAKLPYEYAQKHGKLL